MNESIEKKKLDRGPVEFGVTQTLTMLNGSRSETIRYSDNTADIVFSSLENKPLYHLYIESRSEHHLSMPKLTGTKGQVRVDVDKCSLVMITRLDYFGNVVSAASCVGVNKIYFNNKDGLSASDDLVVSSNERHYLTKHF